MHRSHKASQRQQRRTQRTFWHFVDYRGSSSQSHPTFSLSVQLVWVLSLCLPCFAETGAHCFQFCLGSCLAGQRYRWCSGTTSVSSIVNCLPFRFSHRALSDTLFSLTIRNRHTVSHAAPATAFTPSQRSIFADRDGGGLLHRWNFRGAISAHDAPQFLSATTA